MAASASYRLYLLSGESKRNGLKIWMMTKKTESMSSWGKFVMDLIAHQDNTKFLKSHKYLLKGIQISKWEIWNMGYRDPEAILNGDTPIVVIVVEELYI